MSFRLPMFPLGTVLLPRMVLPLHVFEPRYRQLMRDLVDGDGRFGVTLIERGHEVGGGDLRADVGTIAEIQQFEELEDGRWVTIALGTARFRVDEWLPDDPYPLAMVTTWPDAEVAADPAARDRLQVRLDAVLALARALAQDVEPVVLDDDLAAATWQTAIVAPLGPVDRLAVLCAEDAGQRARLLEERLVGIAEVLEFQLTSED